MTTSYVAETADRPLAEQFTRVFGHAPTPEQLDRYRRARANLLAHFPARVRRRAAMLITRP